MHDNDDGVQGTSEPKDCAPQQHEEDDAPDKDSASEDGFEPLDSYLPDDHESQDDGESE